MVGRRTPAKTNTWAYRQNHKGRSSEATGRDRRPTQQPRCSALEKLDIRRFHEADLHSVQAATVETLNGNDHPGSDRTSSDRGVWRGDARQLQSGRTAGFFGPQGKSRSSFSMVDHLRWDLKQEFDMAVLRDSCFEIRLSCFSRRGSAHARLHES